MSKDGEKSVGKPYEGHSGIGRTSQWLTAEDLQAAGKSEIAVKIEQVLVHRQIKFEGGRVVDVALSLRFVKGTRELLLNRTNTKALNKMHGKTTKDWVDKVVTLFVTQTKVGGETVDCIRIRDKGSRVATAAEAFIHDDEPGDPVTESESGTDSPKATLDATDRDATSGGAPDGRAA